MLNSRLGLFSAAPTSSTGKPYHQPGHPLSRSYGVNLPSSLRGITSPPWYVLPVYQCRFAVRARTVWLEVFPGSVGSTTSGPWSLAFTPQAQARGDLPPRAPYRLGPGRPPPGRPTLLRHSLAHNERSWGRNMNRLSIAYGFRPRLRSRLTLGGQPFPRKP